MTLNALAGGRSDAGLDGLNPLPTKEARMARKLRTFISRLAGDTRADDADVHFHRGPEGHPMVCHDPRCEMPRLRVD
jgi:hypothetical protein